ncbi:MAG: LysM peptidoglycan-binding domain-containing protein [Victivallaceae bacterium]
MQNKYFLFICTIIYSLGSFCFGSVSFSNLHAELEDITLSLKRYDSEISLIYDKFRDIEAEMKSRDSLSSDKSRTDKIESDLSRLNKDILSIKKDLGDSLTKLQNEYRTLNQELRLVRRSLLALINYSEPGETANLAIESPQNRYIVEKGDTLNGIAKKFHTSSDELKKMNNLQKDTIFAGQKLIVPVVKK